MSDDRIIKTYVWHAGICYFVSTITRDSSAALGPERFNETMVWLFDWEKRERGDRIVHQAEDRAGSILRHLAIVSLIHESGPRAFAE